MKNVFLFCFLFIGSFSRVYALTDLIKNGNFDALTPVPNGIPFWVTSTGTGSYYDPCLIVTPTGTTTSSGGAPWAVVGNPTPYYDHYYLQQNVYVPPSALGNTMTLSYEWHVNGWSPPFDYAQARVGSEVLFYLHASYSAQADPTPGWKAITPYIPLGSYSGTTISVIFETYGWATVNNYLYVDDIRLMCDIATPTATPTISPTHTFTPTLTPSPTVTVTPTITLTYTITPTRTLTPTVTPWVVPEGDVIAFPNPASGATVSFMYSPKVDCNVKIDIYNLAGLKVAHLEDRSKFGRGNQVTTWNIQNTAPGIYVYRVLMEGTRGGSSTTRMRKLVITK